MTERDESTDFVNRISAELKDLGRKIDRLHQGSNEREPRRRYGYQRDSRHVLQEDVECLEEEIDLLEHELHDCRKARHEIHCKHNDENGLRCEIERLRDELEE
jgi:hypothetical protein